MSDDNESFWGSFFRNVASEVGSAASDLGDDIVDNVKRFRVISGDLYESATSFKYWGGKVLSKTAKYWDASVAAGEAVSDLINTKTISKNSTADLLGAGTGLAVGVISAAIFPPSGLALLAASLLGAGAGELAKYTYNNTNVHETLTGSEDAGLYAKEQAASFIQNAKNGTYVPDTEIMEYYQGLLDELCPDANLDIYDVYDEFVGYLEVPDFDDPAFQQDLVDFMGYEYDPGLDTIERVPFVDGVNDIERYSDFGEFIDGLQDSFGVAEVTQSPLVLDLDGDGVETLGTDSAVFFDHDNNGFAETATGDVRTISGQADSTRVLAQTEVPTILQKAELEIAATGKSTVTHINF